MSDENRGAVTREVSSQIKGLAIILMLICHCFGNPNRVIIRDFDWSMPLVMSGVYAQICVMFFAFLTGYVYCRYAEKTPLYSLRKIFLFLCSYWFVTAVLLLFATMICGWRPTWEMVFFELFPVREHPLMLHAWYVTFFVVVMIFLPLWAACEQIPNRVGRWVLMGGALTLFVVSVSQSDVFYPWCYSPFCGYLVARFRLIERICDWAFCWPSVVRFVFAGVCFLVPFAVYRQFSSVCVVTHISVLLFFTAIPLLQDILTWLHVNKTLALLGHHSMNMWFIQCVIHSPATREWVQPLVYWCNSPCVVVLTALVFCLLLSMLVTPFQQYFVRWVQSGLLSER